MLVSIKEKEKEKSYLGDEYILGKYDDKKWQWAQLEFAHHGLFHSLQEVYAKLEVVV